MDDGDVDDVGQTVELTNSDSSSVGASRRRRQALIVVGAAIASAAVGIGIGSRLKSPSDAANARKPPPASLITVPVERRTLTSSLTVAGEIAFDQPTPVHLQGAVGESAGQNQVITRLPAIGTPINEGDVLLEVSGRPVFALQGTLPVFRSLEPGSKGPDVAQLETSLERLGFSPGTVDELYDNGTEQALDALYEAKGYASEGPSQDQRKQLHDSRQAFADAEEAVRKAENELRTGGSTVTPSQLLGARQAVDKAQQAVPAAQTAADQANQLAVSNVASATSLRDAAKLARDAAKTIADAAALPGAINPGTSAPYTPIEIGQLQTTQSEREKDLIEAEKSINLALNDQVNAKNDGLRQISDTQDALDLARAELTDLQKPQDTAPLQAAVDQAQKAKDAAGADLLTIEAAVGTKVPAGEIVFLPTLPTNVTNISAAIGATVSDPLLTVSSTQTQITGRVSKTDGSDLTVGSKVTVEIPDAGAETTGTLSQIGSPNPTAPDPNNPNPAPTDSSRLQIVITPDDPAKLRDFVGFTARIHITVKSTEGDVLAVPVAALSVGPDGASRVEVVRSGLDSGKVGSATDGSQPTTEMVTVEVGLAAQGYSEIKPTGGSLQAGDRVVIGVEDTSTADTVGAGLDTSGDTVSTDAPSDSAATDSAVAPDVVSTDAPAVTAGNAAG